MPRRLPLMLDMVRDAADQDFTTVAQCRVGLELGKLGDQPAMVPVEEGVDLAQRDAMRHRHLQSPATGLDTQGDACSTVVLADRQRHLPAAEIERPGFRRRLFADKFSGF